MLDKILGTLNNNSHSKHIKILYNFFNTPDGSQALAWLIRVNLLNSDGLKNLDGFKMAYEAGKIDFIKYLVNLANFDFDIFLEGNNKRGK